MNFLIIQEKDSLRLLTSILLRLFVFIQGQTPTWSRIWSKIIKIWFKLCAFEAWAAYCVPCFNPFSSPSYSKLKSFLTNLNLILILSKFSASLGLNFTLSFVLSFRDWNSSDLLTYLWSSLEVLMSIILDIKIVDINTSREDQRYVANLNCFNGPTPD